MSRDLAHLACPDHPCDRCAICRSGRCCQERGISPALKARINQTASDLFQAMAFAPDSSDLAVQAADDRAGHHDRDRVSASPNDATASARPARERVSARLDPATYDRQQSRPEVADVAELPMATFEALALPTGSAIPELEPRRPDPLDIIIEQKGTSHEPRSYE